MKGVMFSINPEARFIDISNEVPAHDVFHGAFVLGTAFRFFPRDTVHLAVVDPGVGSARRSIAVRTGRHAFVGPDNGLFTFVYREGDYRAWKISEAKYTLGGYSTTFDGRDIYAPVAAYLSLGVSIEEVGPEIEDPVSLPVPEAVYGNGTLKGEVIHVDQFGNLITNIEMERSYEQLRSGRVVTTISGAEIRGPVGSYSEGPAGEAFCLWGSHGFLEVAVNSGKASDLLPDARRGSEILMRYDS